MFITKFLKIKPVYLLKPIFFFKKKKLQVWVTKTQEENI